MADEEIRENADAPEAEGAEKSTAKVKKPLGRRILRAGAAILIVLAALLLVRDFIVEHAVEKGGTYIVGTPVKIGRFRSSLLGRVHIKDLTVANPEGYNNPLAFELGEVKVDLNLRSLLTDKIEVRHIYVSGVNVDYELKLGRSNLGDIQKNLERFAPKDEESPDARNENPSKEDEKAQKQAVIRRLQVTDCSLSFSNATLGTTMKLPLAGLDLENVGDGKPIGETVNDLFGLIFTSVSKAVTGVGGFLGDAATSAGNAISDSAKNVGKSIKELIK